MKLHSTFHCLIGLATLLLIGWFWLEQVTVLHADGITVTTAADLQADDGQCTLREAILNANNNNSSGSIDCASGSSTDTIIFADHYTITLISALPPLSSNLTIDGSGQSVIIDGNNKARVFYIQAGGIVTLSHLSLINGLALGGYGGGILVEDGATLTLLNSSLSNNRAQVVTNPDYGGGIYNNGHVTIHHSAIASNSADFGGGIYNTGPMTIISSTLSHNLASFGGGGINNIGLLTTTNCLLSENSAGFGGGGIDNTGLLTLTNTTLSGNSAGFGGGIYNNGSSPVTISSSTLSDNSAMGDGGGLFNYRLITLVNTTLSGNAAGQSGGGIYNVGILNLLNNTLSDNSAASTGGALIHRDGELHFSNTLMANSANGGDCLNDSLATIATNINNLVEDGSCSAAMMGDPLLGPLQDHGGPTLVHALLPGSPAINAGSNTAAAGLGFDQRGPGFPRILRSIVDLGAFESESDLTTYLPLLFK